MIYADGHIELSEGSSTSGGDIGVRTGQSLPNWPAFLNLSVDVTADRARTVYSPSVYLELNSHAGAVRSNDIETFEGSTYASLAAFPSNMPAIPPAAASTPGTTMLTVPSGTTRTLAATSAYGDVDVDAGATLRLTGGVYQFRTLDLDVGARLEITAPTDIRLKKYMWGYEGNYVGPASGSSLTAKDLVIQSASVDGPDDRVVEFGQITLRALILAPNGTIYLRDDQTTMRGAFVSRRLQADRGVQFIYEDGMPGGAAPPSCDDGNPCNGAEVCDGQGGCVSGTPLAVDDGNPCTVDACSPSAGVTHTAVVCQPLSQCHDAGVCNPATGACSNPPKAEGTNCDDGNLCTTADTCRAGVCQGALLSCPAVDQCQSATCNAQTGMCGVAPRPNGTSCNDGSACTRSDTCQAGVCVGADPVTCTAQDQCHEAGTCNAATGLCSSPNRPNGTTCTDSNACTRVDSCQGGVCTGTDPVVCVAQDQCHDVGTCNPSSGICSNPERAGCSLTPPSYPTPPTDPTVATSSAATATSLTTGPTPRQTGVTPGAIIPARAALITGHVRDRQGAPIHSVRIRVLNHEQLGETLTTADGSYALAVNGSQRLTLRLEKTGFFRADRQIHVPALDAAVVDDVVLVQADAQVTTLDLPAAASIARGSVSTDATGSRQGTLLIPAGTGASIVRPDGSVQTLDRASVRITEYTVGARGPAAMPASLPPTSGYTYAMELSLDEAEAAGANEVRFDQPLSYYVDNFINFPVGGAVPVAYYDRTKQAWIPEPNGRVIRVLGFGSGLAIVDANGDGSADSAAELAALSFTDAERRQLAELYGPGKSLWRVRVTHFTPYDCNWPQEPPEDAEEPEQEESEPEDEEEDPCEEDGSIIECNNRVLGETVSVPGTPFALHYRTSRSPGWRPKLDIPLTGASLPSSLKRVELRVDIAGRRFNYVLPPSLNLKQAFTWDGLDNFGRQEQGSRLARIQIDYVYDAVYQVPADTLRSFALTSGIPLSNLVPRTEMALSQVYSRPLGSIKASPSAGFGGWTPSVHHTYDPESRTLYRGDGKVVRYGVGQYGPDVIRKVSGTGYPTDPCVGCVGRADVLSGINDMAVAPDGAVYVATRGNSDTSTTPNGHWIRKVRDGVITVVAGNGTYATGDPGEGVPATSVPASAFAIALDSRGNLYYVDRRLSRVRRVDSSGIVRTVAGGVPADAPLGDGGPATQANIKFLNFIAVGPDDSLYIGHAGSQAAGGSARIRRVGADGIITTAAGNGLPAEPTLNGPATSTAIPNPAYLTVARDGTVYFSDYVSNLFKISPAGVISAVDRATNWENEEAMSCASWEYTIGSNNLGTLQDLKTDPATGALYMIDGCQWWLIHRLQPNNRLATIAGAPHVWVSGRPVTPTMRNPDGTPAWSEPLIAERMALGPDGQVYFSNSNTIYSVKSPAAGVQTGPISLPSKDGSEIFTFDPSGRHLRTTDSRLRRTLYEFSYDSAGMLTAIRDRDGRMTAIERGADGRPTAIVGPAGRRNVLTSDGNGYLASISSSSSDRSQFTYSTGGLLSSSVDARGATHTFSYDGDGRLQQDLQPAGGSWTINRTKVGTQIQVDMTSATGLRKRFTSERRNGKVTRTVVGSDGRSVRSEKTPDGRETITRPDGTSKSLVTTAHHTLGTHAPQVKQVRSTTPGGVAYTSEVVSSTVTRNSQDPLTVQSASTTTRINGRQYIENFDASSRLVTVTSPAGRSLQVSFDQNGRVVSQTAAGIAPVQYTYDARGRATSIARTSGAAVRRYTFEYDEGDRLVTETDALNGAVRYSYDENDRVNSITAGGRTTFVSYDSRGNLTSVTPPGRTAHLLQYTPRDRLASYAAPPLNGAPASTVHEYRPDNLPSRYVRPDGTEVRFQYQAVSGEPIGVSYSRKAGDPAAGNVTYGFEYVPATGKMARMTASDGQNVAFSYDGRLTTGKTWTGPVSGSVNWTFNNDFRITSETVNGSSRIDIGFDGDAMISSIGQLGVQRHPVTGLVSGTTIGGLSDSRIHDAFGEVVEYDVRFSGSSLYRVVYVRDTLGRIEEKRESLSGQTVVWNYSYNPEGRLWQVMKDGVLVATYLYDSNGNRVSKQTTGGTITSTYDDQDRLLSAGAVAYTYTAAGDLSSKTDTSTGETTRYEYDAVGNLRRVDLPDGRVIEYVIAENLRVGKRINGILVKRWLYGNTPRPIVETDGSGTILKRFAGTEYFTAGADAFRIIKDPLGTPRLVVNAATGVIAQRYDLDEFGTVLAKQGADSLPFGLAGGLYDEDTGLVRFGARDYDPASGRWTAKDPILFAGGQLNLYEYVGSDPVNRVDVRGLEVQVGVRRFDTPIPPPYARHCFVRFNGDDSDTLSFTPDGVDKDPGTFWGKSKFSKTKGEENDACVRREMNQCQGSDYNFFQFNCCHCVSNALYACGLEKEGPWPNKPYEAGRPPFGPKAPPPGPGFGWYNVSWGYLFSLFGW